MSRPRPLLYASLKGQCDSFYFTTGCRSCGLRVRSNKRAPLQALKSLQNLNWANKEIKDILWKTSNNEEQTRDHKLEDFLPWCFFSIVFQ